jgi:diacylglycerol kinase (ATP)
LIKVLVICNPFAGGGTAQKVGADYEAFAQQQNQYNFTFYYTKKPNDLEAIQQQLDQFQPNVVSIVGGDGTVNEVLNVQDVHQLTIHIVPAGSGNDFHRLVYGGISMTESIQSVMRTSRDKYDFGLCNDRYFLNGVGIGFDGSVARETMRMKVPFVSSKWKYWIAIFKNVFFYRSLEVEVETASEKIKRRLFMIAVANGTEYGGGFRISPDSDAQDGLLNLILIDALSPIRRLFNIPKVESGKHLSAPFVTQYKVDKVRVKSQSLMHAHLDGEQMSGNLFDIQVKQGITFVV